MSKNEPRSRVAAYARIVISSPAAFADEACRDSALALLDALECEPVTMRHLSVHAGYLTWSWELPLFVYIHRCAEWPLGDDDEDSSDAIACYYHVSGGSAIADTLTVDCQRAAACVREYIHNAHKLL